MNFFMNLIVKAFIIALVYYFGETAMVFPYIRYNNQSRSDQVVLFGAAGSPMAQNLNLAYYITFKEPITFNGTVQFIFSFSKINWDTNLRNSTTKLQLLSLDRVAFTLAIFNNGSSRVYQISISYIAITDLYDNIFVKEISYDAVSLENLNINDAGNRNQTISGDYYAWTSGQTLNPLLSKNTVIVYLVGFSVRALQQLGISLQTQVTSIQSVSTTIQAVSSCKIYAINLLYVFIDQGKWENAKNVQFHHYKFSNPYNLALQASLKRYLGGSGNWILGLCSIAVDVSDTQLTFKFDYSLQATNSSLALTVSNQITGLSLNLLYIATIYCPTSQPYFSNSSKILCIEKCQDSQTLSPSSNICQTCSSPCKTCQSIPSQCLSCESAYNFKEQSKSCQQITQMLTKIDQQQNQQQNQQQSKQYLLYLLFLIVIPLIFTGNFILIVGVKIYLCFRRKSLNVKIQDIRMHAQITI